MSLLNRISKKGGSPQGGSGGGDDSGDDAKRRAASRKQQVSQGRSRSGGSGGGDYNDLKARIQNKLIAELDPSMDITRKDEVRRQIQELFNSILAEENMVLSKAERQRLFEVIVAEIIGFGPIE